MSQQDVPLHEKYQLNDEEKVLFVKILTQTATEEDLQKATKKVNDAITGALTKTLTSKK